MPTKSMMPRSRSTESQVSDPAADIKRRGRLKEGPQDVEDADSREPVGHLLVIEVLAMPIIVDVLAQVAHACAASVTKRVKDDILRCRLDGTDAQLQSATIRRLTSLPETIVLDFWMIAPRHVQRKMLRHRLNDRSHAHLIAGAQPLYCCVQRRKAC
jgi:hypothetical protein